MAFYRLGKNQKNLKGVRGGGGGNQPHPLVRLRVKIHVDTIDRIILVSQLKLGLGKGYCS